MFGPHPHFYRIRRHADRRYWDVQEHKYIGVNVIAQLIRDGHEVRVTNTKGKDITIQTFALILAKDPSRLPLTLMRELIRHQGPAKG